MLGTKLLLKPSASKKNDKKEVDIHKYKTNHFQHLKYKTQRKWWTWIKQRVVKERFFAKQREKRAKQQKKRPGGIFIKEL